MLLHQPLELLGRFVAKPGRDLIQLVVGHDGVVFETLCSTSVGCAAGYSLFRRDKSHARCLEGFQTQSRARVETRFSSEIPLFPSALNSAAMSPFQKRCYKSSTPPNQTSTPFFHLRSPSLQSPKYQKTKIHLPIPSLQQKKTRRGI